MINFPAKFTARFYTLPRADGGTVVNPSASEWRASKWFKLFIRMYYRHLVLVTISAKDRDRGAIFTTPDGSQHQNKWQVKRHTFTHTHTHTSHHAQGNNQHPTLAKRLRDSISLLRTKLFALFFPFFSYCSPHWPPIATVFLGRTEITHTG